MAASLLLVSQVAPVAAASSASEVVNADGSRPLAGATRYETAALIAQAFVDEALDKDDYVVTSAIVVSGEGFADALSAASLAGLERAPILLTPPNTLANEVESFVSRSDIETVYIVGGTAAVSQSVSDALAAMAGVSVTRFSGADRYATALAIAEQVGGAAGESLSNYCSTGDKAVLLANGEGFADALSGGPLAYDGLLPTLLTTPAELPPAVLSYLETASIDRVVILGGTAAISDAIQTQITDLGIETTRLAGADRFGTATAVTKALTTGTADCGWGAQAFGFANGRSPYDALAGSALLGQRQSPLLLAEPNQLPAATASYLAATPVIQNGKSSNLALSVLGGGAAIEPAVVAQAISSAVNAAPSDKTIDAEVIGYPNEFRFIVNFVEEVDSDSAELRSAYQIDGTVLADKYTVTYYAADPDADNPEAHVLVDLCCTRLSAGAVITVQANTIRATGFGQGDNRYVAAVSYTVPAARPLP